MTDASIDCFQPRNGVPTRDFESLNAVLDRSQGTYTSEIYPATVHGFTVRDTDSFDNDRAARHWDRLRALSKQSFSQWPCSTRSGWSTAIEDVPADMYPGFSGNESPGWCGDSENANAARGRALHRSDSVAGALAQATWHVTEWA